EGRDLQYALRAARQLLAEQYEARGDRDGVRRERGEAGGREGGAVLVGALQDARPEGVGDDEADDGDEPEAAVGHELRGHVARRARRPGCPCTDRKARIAMPECVTACTTECGARRSAATYTSQPAVSAANPPSHRRLPASARTNSAGRRAENGGIDAAASCS